MKPYYVDESVTLYHGDALKILPEIDTSNVDAVVTDPPYGIDFDTDYTRFTSGFGTPRNTHKPIQGDSRPFDPSPFLSYKRVVMWGGNCFSERLPLGTWLVWDKRFDNGTAFLADAEVAWMKGGHGVYIKAQTWQGCVRSEPVQHPTQKPVALMEWCIEKCKTPPGGMVLDPYAGSGTTLVAAKLTGRRAIGIEIEERYCAIAAERLRQGVLFGASA